MAGDDTPMLDDEHHAHHHHTGVKWLDMILAGSAILISVVSLVVSVAHGRTMERLVEENALQVRASTLPILQFDTGNLDAAGKPAIHLDLTNGGTGPAIIDWFELRYAGRPARNLTALVDECCRSGPARPPVGSITNTASRQTLPAGQSIAVFTTRGDGDAATFRRLDRDARFRLTARACYCSVLDQCSITDFRQTRPTPVAECRSSRPPVLW